MSTRAVSKLFEAIRRHDREEVARLLEQGVPPDSRDEHGRSASLVAAWEGGADVLRVLRMKGANLDVTDSLKETAFATDGDMSELGEDVQEMLRYATPLVAAIVRGHAKIVDTLIELGASLKNENIVVTPPLVAAATCGRSEIVRRLLAAGAEIDLGVDRTALYEAARLGDSGMVTLLLDEGATIDLGAEGEETPLMAASSHGHLDVVELLVERGADVDRTSEGDTALSAAARNRHFEIYDFLKPLSSQEVVDDAAVGHEKARRSGGDAIESLIEAIVDGDLPAVTRALETDELDLEGTDADGRTPLMMAAFLGRVEALRLLLQAGADPNTACVVPYREEEGAPDEQGATALIFAAQESGPDAFETDDATTRTILEELAAAGADLDARDTAGLTALHHAVQHGGAGAVGVLLGLGANANLESGDGETPLDCARAGLTNIGEQLSELEGAEELDEFDRKDLELLRAQQVLSRMMVSVLEAAKDR